MRLIWIGVLVLLVASLASLVSHQQSGRLVDESWAMTADVLPVQKMAEIQQAVPAYARKFFSLLPGPLRDKFAVTLWKPVELMAFRSLLLWHLTPALLVPMVLGTLEGWWARASSKALIKMHSPMRFSLALTMLGLVPVLALLWVTAPIAVSATLLVVPLGTITIFAIRDVIVHAPTQF